MSESVSFTADVFQQMIAREHDTVELKTGTGQKPLQEAFVAMSNTDGGHIYIGVRDDRTVVGRKRDQGTDDAINRAAHDAHNIGRYSIAEAEVEGVPIVVVTVEPRCDEVAQTSDGRVLVRRGARNDALFGTDLWTLMAARSVRRYEVTDSGVSVRDVDSSSARQIAQRYGWDERSDWTKRWFERGLSTVSGELTVTGALVLTDPAQTLRSARFHIDLRSFTADHGTSYIRRENIGGTAQHQVEAATDWVQRDVGTEMVVTGATRHDIPRIPPRPLREAISNAVAHRDYSVDHSSIVIEVRPSGVLIRSPGALLPSVHLDNLREAQAARNPSLIDVLRRFGLAENSGQGIDLIQDGMRSELLDEPVFREDDGFFEVVLPTGGAVTATERAWLTEYERRHLISDGDRPLLLSVLREGRITNARARDLMGVDSVKARASLQRLCRAHLLVQHGERRRSYYTLGALGPGKTPEQIVMQAASSGERLTNGRTRELTGLTRREALMLLSQLVSDGKLTRTGTRRGTRYVLRRGRVRP
jgi:ATP-dependent DNA helicase RecG